MISLLRKSLSGEKTEKPSTENTVVEKSKEDETAEKWEQKQAKRHLSGEASPGHTYGANAQKRKRLARSRATASEGAIPESPITELPEGTPEWGVKLLEIMQNEFRAVSLKVDATDLTAEENKRDIETMERKLTMVEAMNKNLVKENIELKEKLLDLEFRQRKNNLIFDGIHDTEKETDLDCIKKLRFVLKDIAGLDVQNFRIDRCHHLGQYRPTMNRRVICAFNWQYDVQCVLRSRKRLPKGIYVTEDLPEEWADRRKILKPIFNAARRDNSLKDTTKWSKDRLFINGQEFSAGPRSNLSEVNTIIDTRGTCQKGDASKEIFLGTHSPFSNLHMSDFTLSNRKYSCVEQFIQSKKAIMFNDDIANSKILQESNPYTIKKLGSKIRKFNSNQWNKY